MYLSHMDLFYMKYIIIVINLSFYHEVLKSH